LKYLIKFNLNNLNLILYFFKLVLYIMTDYLNLFNEPFILKNIKEQITDVDFNKKITQFRALPDEVTSIFTDIFLNDSNSNLLKFIKNMWNNYPYSIIYIIE
jgi:hypothetical protein